MSNREKCIAMLDGFSDAQLVNVAVMLQTMQQTISDAITDETPNAETIAAMQEVNEMIRPGSGQRFKGSTAELFAMLDAEDPQEAK